MGRGLASRTGEEPMTVEELIFGALFRTAAGLVGAGIALGAAWGIFVALALIAWGAAAGARPLLPGGWAAVALMPLYGAFYGAYFGTVTGIVASIGGSVLVAAVLWLRHLPPR